MTEQALSITHPDPFRLLPAHHTTCRKLLEPTALHVTFLQIPQGSCITRQHLTAMTVTGCTLRYCLQAQLQFGRLQQDLDKAISLQMHAGQDHSREWAMVSQSRDNELLSHSAVLKYFMHSSPHQEASGLQNNMGHGSETGLPMHCQPLPLGEGAAYFFGAPSKQTFQVTKSAQWQKRLTDMGAVKQSSSGAISPLL